MALGGLHDSMGGYGAGLTLVAIVVLLAFIAVGILRPAWRRGWGRLAEAPVDGPVHKYDAFRRARPAAAGRRPPHPYHQYASGVRRGQRRPVHSPGYAPYFRTGPVMIKTGCPYCGVGCGLVAEVRDGRLHAVRGDDEHPVNRGRTCRKPLALPEASRTADRARHAPAARRAGRALPRRELGRGARPRRRAAAGDPCRARAARRSRSTSPASC